MIESAQLRSGKGHRDENFPVASWLIRREHRPVILAFYEFVRVADDIADHPSLPQGEKLARLGRLEASLTGKDDGEPEGALLRAMLHTRDLSPRHAQDLLKAFRQDVTKHRYANWDDLIGYCALSAMPVGRFVLDVHGEAHATWPASDALCAALQIINHLQDCAADYRRLDRVYVPLDALASHGLDVTAFGEKSASARLKACLGELAVRTRNLLAQSRPLPSQVSDARLAMEIAAMQALARRLIRMLRKRDPLSEPVHLGKARMLAIGAGGAMRGLLQRMLRSAVAFNRPQTHGSRP
ncbi:MAG TPA: squalene synthase HpnC [Pseudolabrys sp.]|nr:squalene synthase HpnC [Pseudolabrys sp.]